MSLSDDVYSEAAANDRLLRHLNPEQLAAVTLPAQPALILAGAGSGKTRVLTTRIAWLLNTGQVSPAGLLAVTFTNKAAKEMLTRLTTMLPVNVRGMWIGTFHGLCNRFLRAHWKLAGLPQSFQILDSADSLSAVKRVIKGMNLDEEAKLPSRRADHLAAILRHLHAQGYRDPHQLVRDVRDQFLDHPILRQYGRSAGADGRVSECPVVEVAQADRKSVV